MHSNNSFLCASIIRVVKSMALFWAACFVFCSAAAFGEGEVLYVDRNATGNGNGASWENAALRISDALTSTGAEGGEIWVAKGVYSESITLKSNVRLYGGFEGDETNRSERDPLTRISCIDGSKARDGEAAFQVVIIDSISDLVLDGFTIRGGDSFANADVAGPKQGG